MVAYAEWKCALNDWWYGNIEFLKRYESLDFWLTVIAAGPIAGLALVVTQPALGMLENAQNFLVRMRRIPALALLKSFQNIIPVPRKLQQKVVTLADCVVILVKWITEEGLVQITAPAPAWVTAALNIRKNYKWLDAVLAITPIKAAGLVISTVVTFLITLINLTIGVGATIVLLLMLWDLAEMLQNEERTAAFFERALPQDSRKILITQNSERRVNVRRGKDTDAKTPKFL
jgi:hypothetical protein